MCVYIHTYICIYVCVYRDAHVYIYIQIEKKGACKSHRLARSWWFETRHAYHMYVDLARVAPALAFLALGANAMATRLWTYLPWLHSWNRPSRQPSTLLAR